MPTPKKRKTAAGAKRKRPRSIPLAPLTLGEVARDISTQLTVMQGSLQTLMKTLGAMQQQSAPLQVASVAFNAVIPGGQLFAFEIADGPALLADRMHLHPQPSELILEEIRTWHFGKVHTETLGAARPRPVTGELNTLPSDFRFVGKLLKPGDRIIVRNPTELPLEANLIITGYLETAEQLVKRFTTEHRAIMDRMFGADADEQSAKVEDDETARARLTQQAPPLS